MKNFAIISNKITYRWSLANKYCDDDIIIKLTIYIIWEAYIYLRSAKADVASQIILSGTIDLSVNELIDVFTSATGILPCK